MRIERWLQLAGGLAVLCFSACSGTTGGDNRNFHGPGAGGGSGGSSSGGGAGNPLFSNPNAPINTGAGGKYVNQAEVTCGKSDLNASRILPSVMLVVDGSSSMQSGYGAIPTDAGVADGGMGATMGGGIPGITPPAAGQSSRWGAVRTALIDPTNGVVPKLQGLVKFGLAVFGTQPSCPLPAGIIDPALNNAPAITSGLPVQPPGTYTPTGVALDMIVDKLPDPSQALDGTIEPQIIVLATDGDPNSCGMGDPNDPLGALLAGPPMTDYAPSIAAAMKLQAKHQRMYVISVGQDAAKQHLQEMANLGAGLQQNESPGATVYYPEDPAALADTLAMLIGKEVPCDVELSGKGVVMGSECMGTVTINGNELPCNGPDGWKLKDATHITLQGMACEMFKNASDAMLHAEFPCEALIPS
jgi:hypothetical protein